MTTKKRWVIGVMLVVLGFVAYSWLSFRANLPLSGYDWSYMADTEVVNLQVGPHRFAIPKNYLFKGSTRKDGFYNYFTVVLLMPGFKPYSEELQAEFARPEVPRMFIDISTRRSRPKITEMFYNSTQRIGQAQQLFGSLAPGLIQYASKLGSPTEMYFRFVGEQVTHFMSCTPAKSAPSPSCKVDIDYSNDVVVDYTFPRTYLEHWQLVDEHVRTLLAEWERNGAQEQR